MRPVVASMAMIFCFVCFSKSIWASPCVDAYVSHGVDRSSAILACSDQYGLGDAANGQQTPDPCVEYFVSRGAAKGEAILACSDQYGVGDDYKYKPPQCDRICVEVGGCDSFDAAGCAYGYGTVPNPNRKNQ